MSTTAVGFENRNGQRVVRKTDLPGTDHLQKVYAMLCTKCSATYGANGSDIHHRNCPICQGGATGLGFD